MNFSCGVVQHSKTANVNRSKLTFPLVTPVRTHRCWMCKTQQKPGVCAKQQGRRRIFLSKVSAKSTQRWLTQRLIHSSFSFYHLIVIDILGNFIMILFSNMAAFQSVEILESRNIKVVDFDFFPFTCEEKTACLHKFDHRALLLMKKKKIHGDTCMPHQRCLLTAVLLLGLPSCLASQFFMSRCMPGLARSEYLSLCQKFKKNLILLFCTESTQTLKVKVSVSVKDSIRSTSSNCICCVLLNSPLLKYLPPIHDEQETAIKTR